MPTRRVYSRCLQWAATNQQRGEKLEGALQLKLQVQVGAGPAFQRSFQAPALGVDHQVVARAVATKYARIMRRASPARAGARRNSAGWGRTPVSYAPELLDGQLFGLSGAVRGRRANPLSWDRLLPPPQKAIPKTRAGVVRRHCAISASMRATNSRVSLWFGVQKDHGVANSCDSASLRQPVGLQYGLAFVASTLHHALRVLAPGIELG